MEERNTIFKLIVIEYHNDNHQYPEFDVFRDTIGCFSSREEAEQAMNKYEEEYDKTQHSLYGFIIEEYETEEDFENAEWADRNSYIPDDFTLLLGENIFTYKKCKGNLVEVLRENTVTLEIVAKLPVPPTILDEIDGYVFSLEGNPYFITITNDETPSYTIETDMFPPRFPVSDELRKKLEEVVNEDLRTLFERYYEKREIHF